VATFVADTHALVWHLTSPDRLGRGARRAFAAADSATSLVCVPAITLVEIALLHERRRIGASTARVLETLGDHPGYAVLALDAAQALEFAALVGVKDPMDRLVVAAARATNARLISSDEALDGYGVERVWD
jgi:PIN domain nuclease of toxin-antitoxin system